MWGELPETADWTRILRNKSLTKFYPLVGCRITNLACAMYPELHCFEKLHFTENISQKAEHGLKYINTQDKGKASLAAVHCNLQGTIIPLHCQLNTRADSVFNLEQIVCIIVVIEEGGVIYCFN